MAQTDIQPPNAVKLAIICFWAGFIFIVLGGISLVFLPISENTQLSADKLGISADTYITIKLGTYPIWAAIVYFVLNQLKKGQNWAKIACLIWGILQIVFSVGLFFKHSNHDNITVYATIGVSVLHISLNGYALYLLFTAPGKDWFIKRPN